LNNCGLNVNATTGKVCLNVDRKGNNMKKIVVWTLMKRQQVKKIWS